MQTEEPVDVDYASYAHNLLGFSRWWQIAAAAAMMAVVSPYQYAWSSFQNPIADGMNVSLSAVATTFTLFVIFMSIAQFPAGWWRDRYGPRLLIVLAAFLAGSGYLGSAYATSVWQLYLTYSVGAVGVGIVYTVAINTAIKWFPDKSGFTTGLGTMAFAGGSAMVVPYVRANATAAAYPVAFRNIGIVMFCVIFVGAFLLRDPPDSWFDRIQDEQATEEHDDSTVAYKWRQTIRTWQFWVMYAMFVAISSAGLMLTAQIVSFAEYFGLGAIVATASATLLPIASGTGRMILGGISDRLGRERLMAVSFIVCGLGLALIVAAANTGSSLVLVVLVVVATFFWASQFSLFPSLMGDYYGLKYSSSNYALLYSGKMWGGVFGGSVTGWLVVTAGWNGAFLIGAGLSILAGIGALVLRSPRAPSSSAS